MKVWRGGYREAERSGWAANRTCRRINPRGRRSTLRQTLARSDLLIVDFPWPLSQVFLPFAQTIEGTTYRLLIIAAGCACCVLLNIGCGGSGEAETLAHVSKQQFIKQAEAVCAKAQKERNAAYADLEQKGREEPAGPTQAEMKQVLARSLINEAKQLRALPPPQVSSEDISQMVQTLNAVGERIADEGSKALGSPLIQRLPQEIKELGLAKCP